MYIERGANRTENSFAPKPALLTGIMNENWKSWSAIAELIDNSFGEGRGNATTVHITYDRGRGTLEVFDAGQGMDHIVKAFRLGDSAGTSVNDIGRYGCGGTKAMLWLASKVRLWTMRGNGKVMRDTVVWADVLRANNLADVRIGKRDWETTRSKGWENASLNNTPQALLMAGTGTYIELTLAKKRRNFSVDKAKTALSIIFGPGLRGGRNIVFKTIERNGDEEEIALSASAFPSAPTHVITFTDEIEHEGHTLPFKGEVGVYEQLSVERSKISIGYGCRVITQTKDCFVSPEGDERYHGRGIAGYVDLGHGWQEHEFLTQTKEDISEDLKPKLMAAIFHHIKPLLQQTEQHRLEILVQNLALNISGILGNLSDDRFAATLDDNEGDEMEGGSGEAEEEGAAEPRPLRPVRNDLPRQWARRDENGPSWPNENRTENNEGRGNNPTTRRRRRRTPMATKVSPELLSDAEMDYTMCKAEFLGQDELRVMLNEDHPKILECINSERMADRVLLTSLMTGEMAKALINSPQVLERALAPSLKAKLAVYEDNPDQQTLLLERLLFDSAHFTPPPEDAEAEDEAA